MIVYHENKRIPFADLLNHAVLKCKVFRDTVHFN